MPTIHRHLDDELHVLGDLLMEMSYLVDEQLADAVDALSKLDLEQAERVRLRDDEIDALEIKIDRQCERILALHQPVASELRLIITAIKINTDLERIGDHAKNLARAARVVAESPGALAAARLTEMADAARAMLRKVQDAFVNRDRVAAREVVADDQTVDRLYQDVLADLVAYGQAHPDELRAVSRLFTSAKSIERISDHAKNIAEQVVFVVEGTDIRHRKLQRRP